MHRLHQQQSSTNAVSEVPGHEVLCHDPRVLKSRCKNIATSPIKHGEICCMPDDANTMHRHAIFHSQQATRRPIVLPENPGHLKNLTHTLDTFCTSPHICMQCEDCG